MGLLAVASDWRLTLSRSVPKAYKTNCKRLILDGLGAEEPSVPK
jgi:hypothetical protein